MERSFLERQARFVQLYFRLSRDEDMCELRNSPLLPQIVRVCVDTLLERIDSSQTARRYLKRPVVPLHGTPVEIDSRSLMEQLLEERLRTHSQTQDYFAQEAHPTLVSVQNVAYLVTEAYRHHLFTRAPRQNISLQT